MNRLSGYWDLKTSKALSSNWKNMRNFFQHFRHLLMIYLTS
uniref:Centrosomal protein 70 n=1 Tax=Rousettus aegyptiacus TaxID=9407 RepID=A0A7J8HNY4_ROUAE|nr:centrosomal protein 70 [Rousettus aegyptiacus]